MKRIRFFWLMLMLLVSTMSFMPVMAQEQTATINSSTTYTTPNVPLYGGGVNNGIYTQFIVPSTYSITTSSGESTMSALAGKMITRLTFYANTTSEISWGNATFNVKLAEVTNSSFTSAAAITATSTTVYSGSLSVGADGKMIVTFNEPFEYNGGNLLVDLSSAIKGTANNVNWYYSSSSNCGVYKYGGYSYNKVNTMPKMSIDYITVPKNLTATDLTKKSATLTWDAADSETAWQLSYSTTAGDPGNGTLIDNLTSTSYTFNNLTPETTYYVYVRAVKGDGEYGDWSKVYAFKPTAAVPVEINSSATNTNSRVPLSGYYVNYITNTQFIVPSTYSITTSSGESTMSALAGKITELTFYANTTSTISWGDATFDVKLAEVTNTSFTSAAAITTASTTVFSGSLSVGADGKMVVTFNEPFEYNGGNLLVDFTQTTRGTYKSVPWYCSSVSNYCCVYNYNGRTYELDKYMPKMSIGYLAVPNNLTAVSTNTSATITWDAAGSETAWQLSYSATEGDPDNGTMVNDLTSRSCTISDLTEGTTYYAYVRAVESDGEYGNWSKVCMFIPCATLTINDGAETNSYVPLNGSYAKYYNVSSQFIIPKEMMGGGHEIEKLTFYAKEESVSFESGSSFDEFDIFLTETDNTAFKSTPAAYSGETKVYSGKLSVENGKMEIKLSQPFEYSGSHNLQIAFSETKGGVGATTTWYGVTSGITSNCAEYSGYYSGKATFLPKTTFVFNTSNIGRPKNLVASNVTGTTATLSWDAVNGVDGYELRYGTVADPEDEGNTVVSNLTEVTHALTGLTPKTTYHAYVRAKGGSEYSSWSTVCNFTTPALYAVQDGITYELNDEGNALVVTSCDDAVTAAVISAAVSINDTDYPVTTIANDAFKNHTALTEITIPVRVTAVGSNAFSGCTNVKTLHFGINTSLDATSMYNISNVLRNYVTTLDITEGTTAIPDGTNYSSSSSLYAKSFNYWSKVTTLTLPSTLKTIGNYAFYNCTALTKVTIPAAVTAIGTDAFRNCTSVIIATFEGTTPPTWSDGTTGNQFNKPTGTYMIVPSTEAYAGWTAWVSSMLTSEPVINGVFTYSIDGSNATIIGYNGTGTEVTIPASFTHNETTYDVVAIADDVFKGKTSVTTVTFERATPPAWPDGTVGEEFNTSSKTILIVPEASEAAYKTAYEKWAGHIYTEAIILDKIIFALSGNEATIVGYTGTRYDFGASKITIPATVTSGSSTYNVVAINDGVFYNMYWIWNVYFEGTTPPAWNDGTVGNEFGGTSATKIYVWEENLDNYKTTYTAWASNIYAKPDFTFSYNTTNKTAQVSSYDGRGGDVTIPATVVNPADNEEYTVTEIATGNSGGAFRSKTTVTSVSIPNTVTSIGTYAFADCTNLTTVNFPAAPANTTIKQGAFSSCTSLKSLTLPEGLTSIESSAFRDCSALTTVTIPSTVTSIDLAFYNCSGVKTVNFLPTTPPTWSDATNGLQFGGTAKTKLIVPKSEDNAVLQAYQTAYTAWYNADAITTSLDNYITLNGLKYVIIEGTTNAKLVGFDDDVPAEAVIAATVNNGEADFTVTTIDEKALQNCTSITSLTIPATVTAISGYNSNSPFIGCSNVTEVHFLGTTPPTWNNQIIATDFNTPANTVLIVPAEALEAYQTAYTRWMASTYAEGTTIPDLSVFTFSDYHGTSNGYYCTLTGYSGDAVNVAIPEYVNHDEKIYSVMTIAGEVFKNHTELTDITIPSSVVTIGTSAFEGCTGLTAVTIPYTGTSPSIGASVFKGCTSLASATLPAQLEIIPVSAFENCEALTGITLPSAQLRFINASAFKNSGLTSITIPLSVSRTNSGRITRGSFAGCTDLSDVYLEGQIVWEGDENEAYGSGPAASEFATTAETTLHVEDGTETWYIDLYPEWINRFASPNIVWEGNFRYLVKTHNVTGEKTITLFSYLGTEDAKVVIPASVDVTDETTGETVSLPVTVIDQNVFAGHTEITDMFVPESVKNIEMNAFENMDNLATLVVRGEANFEIPLDASTQFGPNTVIVQPIENLNNNNLAHVLEARPGTSFYSGDIYEYPFVYTIADDNTLIVKSYVANDQASVTIPATVTDPYDGTEYDEMILPDGLFWDHTEITSISAPSVTGIGLLELDHIRASYIFPTSLTSLSLPALKTIPDSSFPAGDISGLSKGVFQQLTNLQSIDLSSVEHVGKNAFTGLSNLTELNLPSVTSLADQAIVNVSNCTINLPNLTELTDTMQVAGLQNCTLNIPNVTDLRGQALVNVDLHYCNTVDNVTINAESIRTIADGAFKPTTKSNEGIDLSGATLNFPNMERVGNASFYKTKIGSLAMDKLTWIGDSAFMKAEIPNVKVPYGVTHVGKKAFFACCMDVLRWYSAVNIPDSCFAYNMCMEYATVGDELVLNGASSGVTTVGPERIGDGAFMACPYLKNINLGNSVKHIGKNFLKYGRAITQLIIPSSVEKIGDGFIQGCDHLRKCYLFNQPAEIAGQIDGQEIYQMAEEGSMANPDSLVVDGVTKPTNIFDAFRNKPETFSKTYVHSFMPSANYSVHGQVQADAQDKSPCYKSSMNAFTINIVSDEHPEDNSWIDLGITEKTYYDLQIGVNIVGLNKIYPEIAPEAQDEPTLLNVKRLARAGWAGISQDDAEGVSEYAEKGVTYAEHVNNCTFYVNDNDTYHNYINAVNENGIKVWERLDSLSEYNLAGTHGWAKYTGYEMTDEIRNKYFEPFGNYWQQWDDITPTNGRNKYPPFTSYTEEEGGLRYTSDHTAYRPKITYYDVVQRGIDKFNGMAGWSDYFFNTCISPLYGDNKSIDGMPVHSIDSISSFTWGAASKLYYHCWPRYETGCLGNGEATTFGDNYMYTIYFREKNFPKAKGTPGQADFEWGGYRNKYQIVPTDTLMPPNDTWVPIILPPNYDGPIAVLRSCTANKTTTSNPNETGGTTTNTKTSYQLRFELVPKSTWWNDPKYVGKPCLIKGTHEWNYQYGEVFESPYWTADTRVTVPVTGDVDPNTTVSMIGCKLDHMLDIDEFYITTKNLTNPITHKTSPQMVFKQTTEYGGYVVDKFGAYFRIECDGIPVHDTKLSGSMPSSARVSAVFVDEEDNVLTDINEYQMEPEHMNEGVYNLNGQRVSSNLNSLPAGIYIVNGKKVTVNGNNK